MTIAEFISGVTQYITSQTKPHSITPGVVGAAFTNLAHIVNLSGGTGDLSLYYTRDESDAIFLTSASTLNWGNVSDTPILLAGYGITSGDTLFDTKYLPISSGETIVALESSANTIYFLISGNTQNINSLSGITSSLQSDLTLVENTYLTSSGASSSYQPIGSYVSASTLNDYYTTGQTDSLYYPLSGNPTGFLTSASTLNWAKILGTPTSLVGYGITSGDTLFNGIYAPFGNYVSASTINNYLTLSGASSSYLPISSGQTILNLQTGLTAAQVAINSDHNLITGNTASINILQTGLTFVESIVSGGTLATQDYVNEAITNSVNRFSYNLYQTIAV